MEVERESVSTLILKGHSVLKDYWLLQKGIDLWNNNFVMVLCADMGYQALMF